MAQKKGSPRAATVRTGALTKLVLALLLLAVGWQLYSLRGQVAQAQAEKERYAAQVDAIQRENNALASDIADGGTTEKMEEIARDELDWTYSDEYVFYDKRS